MKKPGTLVAFPVTDFFTEKFMAVNTQSELISAPNRKISSAFALGHLAETNLPWSESGKLLFSLFTHAD